MARVVPYETVSYGMVPGHDYFCQILLRKDRSAN